MICEAVQALSSELDYSDISSGNYLTSIIRSPWIKCIACLWRATHYLTTQFCNTQLCITKCSLSYWHQKSLILFSLMMTETTQSRFWHWRQGKFSTCCCHDNMIKLLVLYANILTLATYATGCPPHAPRHEYGTHRALCGALRHHAEYLTVLKDCAQSQSRLLWLEWDFLSNVYITQIADETCHSRAYDLTCSGYCHSSPKVAMLGHLLMSSSIFPGHKHS